MERLIAAGLLCVAGISASPAADLAVPGEFDSIQAAIDAADPGDVVLVEPGTYTENLVMRTDIDVRGRETARTLLEPESADPTVSMAGIQGATLANFTIIDATIGVLIANSGDLVIANVVFDAATNAAIDVDLNSTVEITNNVFFENATAIRRLSDASRIENNLFVGNTTTIASPVGLFDSNIAFNGFFDNDDLRPGDIDTALGTDFQIGDPEFVDPAARDFHLRAGSQAIDAGTGTDVIDDSVADLGAYGGVGADARPFPVSGLTPSDASGASPPPFAIALGWDPNLDYRVSGGATPGSYRVYYRQNGDGPPYPGTDAGGGAQPSPIDVGNQTEFVLENLAPGIDAPVAPQLLAADPRNETVVLSWSDVPGATGYRVSYGIASIDENTIDLGEATGTTVTGLANGTTYQFAVAAARRPVYHIAVTAVDGTQNRNESAFSEEAEMAVGATSFSVRSNTLRSTPEVTVPVPDLPDKGCFIATAAFGAHWQPQVAILRDFRDRVLLRNAFGRGFVAWYYEQGPQAAAWLNQHSQLKAPVRAVLLPLVAAALVLLAATPAQWVVLGGLLLAWHRTGRSRRRDHDGVGR